MNKYRTRLLGEDSGTIYKGTISMSGPQSQTCEHWKIPTASRGGEQ
jgi:hypothetical protein